MTEIYDVALLHTLLQRSDAGFRMQEVAEVIPSAEAGKLSG